jgi:hypothetical protein
MNRCVLLVSLFMLVGPLSTEALPHKTTDEVRQSAANMMSDFSSSLRDRAFLLNRGKSIKTTTQVGALAEAFQPVHSRHQDPEQLLHACYTFVDTMRRTGQSSVARDLENNVRKVEALYNKAPTERRQSLLSLLEFERESGIHGSGGTLMDPSGAIGLLWIRRSLSFQTKMYKGILEAKADATAAALDAYRSELQPYHGWAFRKLYTMSFETVTPPRREMLARIGGYKIHDFGEAEEHATVQDLRKLVSVWEPLIVHWKRIYRELDLEDSRQV